MDVRPSPNIWRWPEIYQVENRAQDVDGAVWRALRELADWAGRDVVDVGCGDGFHLPIFAERARSVVGVEPHRPLARRAAARIAALANAGTIDNVTVLAGGAQRLPLPDDCADVVHARTAYFFGPGCEPGLFEADRVLRRGGVLAIVDLDAEHSPYGDWLRADLPAYRQAEVLDFFAAQGFSCHRVATTWRFDSRADLESVLRIEFSAAVAALAIASCPDLTIPVGYRIHIRHKPTGIIVR